MFERYEWQCKGQKGIPVPVHQTIWTQTKLLLLAFIDAWRNPLLSHLYVFFKMAAFDSDVLVMICYNVPPRAHAGKDCGSAISLLWWRKVKPMSLLLTRHEDPSPHFVINQKWIRYGVGTFISLFRVPDCTNYKLVLSYTYMHKLKSQFRLSCLKYCNNSPKACHYFWNYIQMTDLAVTRR